MHGFSIFDVGYISRLIEKMHTTYKARKSMLMVQIQECLCIAVWISALYSDFCCDICEFLKRQSNSQESKLRKERVSRKALVLVLAFD